MNANQTPLSHRQFWVLPEVIAQQEIQQKHPHGSEQHKAAFEKLVELARTHCGEQAAGYFGNYND